ncbi:RNA polymerase, sigma-24 subunit, ECF subfamily [Paenibacillus curdlanolyticus YK9]|uniref:RNA polymerase, sigma-24 subunit, ECF subfamily n=1 Tax=Paenibacillus curdlanolyticus YK9 TaxID=717606 RepID=E0ID38_9BACL|nr:sigma-70 family RNA polymerase sigma factor [Paenibacillus curdlanolyticus]EFM09493.1 RNA polymerase, sigma-24 subunit, ECF subfamily [Paenibacillus curdlanolyticus YK9]
MVDLQTAYAAYYPYLHSVAYHMLGSVSEAEDIVQELFLDVHDHLDSIEHVKTYLARATTNRCLNVLQSARVRREVYPGVWLPEPASEGDWQQPHQVVEQRESLSYAFMVMLEQLEPMERAIIVLREGYDYPYSEIAVLLDKSEANCRKIYSRGKKKLDPNRVRPATDQAHMAACVELFVKAFQSGDSSTLIRLLTDTSILISDGGGKVNTAINPLYGRERVVAFLLGVSAKRYAHLTYAMAVHNGQPGVVFYENGNPAALLMLEMESEDHVFRGLYFVVNPDKVQSCTADGRISEELARSMNRRLNG